METKLIGRMSSVRWRAKSGRRNRIERASEINEAHAQVEHIGSAREHSRGFIISLSAGALFPPDGWRVLPSAHVILDRVAAFLAERDGDISVEGHTDSAGSIAERRALSFHRALAVAEYLIGLRISFDRVQAKGLGDSQPVASNETTEGRASNRRVEIVLERPPGSADALHSEGASAQEA